MVKLYIVLRQEIDRKKDEIVGKTHAVATEKEMYKHFGKEIVEKFGNDINSYFDNYINRTLAHYNNKFVLVVKEIEFGEEE